MSAWHVSHGAQRVCAVLSLSLALLLAAPVGEAQQPPLKGYPASANVTMRIYVPAGRIRVGVWNRDSIHVSGTIGASAVMFGGGNRTHVKLGVEPKITGDPTLPAVDWVVTIPRGARVWIKMIDGAVSVTGTTGELEMYNVRGSVDAQNVSGVTSIESIDAPVTVTGARGDVRVRGGAGAVRLDDVRGTLSVATVSGSVTLSQLLASGRVETIGGSIGLTTGSLAKEAIELQTHSGNIALTLDAARTPRLLLSSRAGPILGDKLTGADAFGVIDARSFKGRIMLRTMAPKK